MCSMVWVLALLAASAASPASEHLEDTVRMLKGQVQALLEQKEQESQIAQELKEIREEVAVLKAGSKRGHNVEVRLGWLESSVSEARGQVGELGAAVAKERALAAEVAQLRTLLDRQTQEVRSLRASMQSLHAKVLETHEAWSNHKQVEKSSEKHDKHKETEDNLVEVRRRHHRGLRAEVEAAGAAVGALVRRVENLERRTASALEANKVRASVLELLETVQGLEAKLDSTVPSLQKEISRTELSLAQVMQQSAIIKEAQDNARSTMKALSLGVSNLQEKINSRHSSHLPAKEYSRNVTARGLLSNLTKVISDYEQIISHLPHDCSGMSELLGEGLVRPGGEGQPLLVECQAGWTVVQRRSDGSQDFNKNWEQYAKGFGSPTGEVWLGLEALHRLTQDNNTSLRVNLVDIYGGAWYAEYASFRVGPREDGFRLHVSGYSGNASDALDYQNGMEFSAVDVDRDTSNTHCAANYEGGWWYSHCEHANLNGRYNLGLTWFHAGHNEWIAVDKSTMMIRTHTPSS